MGRKYPQIQDDRGFGEGIMGSQIGGTLGNGRPSFWGVTEGARGEWRRGGVKRRVASE